MNLLILIGCVLILVLAAFTIFVVKSVIKSEENKPKFENNSAEWNHIKDFKNILEDKKDRSFEEEDVQTVGASFDIFAEFSNTEDNEDDDDDMYEDISLFKNEYETRDFDSDDEIDVDATVDVTQDITAGLYAKPKISVTFKYTDGDLEKVMKMTSPKITVGRDIGSDLLLSGYSFISRNHAVFSLKDGKLFLEDLNSKNGTEVNGERIQGEVLIEESCDVTFGKLVVKVIISENEV